MPDNPDPREVAREFGEPVDEAPQIPGDFGVDTDPYTEDDSRGQGCGDEPEPDE